MESFLNAIRIWQRDPHTVFAFLGAVAGMLGILLFFVGGFPLSPVNFCFFFVLFFLLGLYRPNWCFLLLVAVAPFETINVVPDSFGFSLRLYQWLFLTLTLALILRVFSGRSPFPLFAWSRLDFFLALIPIGALVSGMIGGGQGIRLGIIVGSFYALYILCRIFLKTIGDVRIALATLLASGLVMALYAIVQNIAFERGIVLQAVMPGRPNAFFAEPDWLGFFIALLLVAALRRFADVLSRPSEDFSGNLARVLLVAALLLPISIALILTVSRSAWLAALAGIFTWASVEMLIGGKRSLRIVLQSMQSLVVIFVIALVIVIDIPLTRFNLFDRAESTATGLQEITVACDQDALLPVDPITIQDVGELSEWDCRHILLEEIETERSLGKFVTTVYRPDPNIAIRSEIYSRTWKEVQAHPIFGIGWGNIGLILGTDEHGSSYNASNIWLEIILGAGVLGLAGLLGTVGTIAYWGFRAIIRGGKRSSETGVVPFAMAFLVIFFIFNLFNAGLLIAFVWILLAMAPAALSMRKAE